MFFISLSVSVVLFGARAFARETERDLIKKARQMLLQKERVAALSMLSAAAQKERKLGHQQASKNLIEAIDEISRAFILDKSQQAYEMALSLADAEPEEALSRLLEAQKLEPKNFVIELQIIRTQLALRSCSEASNGGRALAALNPFSEEVHLALGQAAACSKDYSELQKLAKTNPGSSQDLAVFWELLSAEEKVASGEGEAVKTKLRALAQTHEKFPSVFYWLWRTENPQSPEAEQAAQKYLVLCTSPSAALRRKYLLDPFFCRQRSEVESYLKEIEQ